jgi:DNA polymerase III epsilon subunit-like protein
MKILVLDIETAPKKAYVWGAWKQNISANQLISDWYMLSWSAKWFGDDNIYGEVLTGKEALDENDERIMETLWHMLDEADVIVAHNGDKFDVPSINTRFLVNGYPPPSPYKSIDTLKIAKRKFKFTYNRLDYLGEFLGVGGKLETGGMDLWIACVSGDETALAKMAEYNDRDITLLEDVYVELRPYALPHPNHGVTNPEAEYCCSRCGSENVQKRGYYTTNISKFHKFVCKDCGSWSRARVNIRSKEEMETTLLPI